MKQSSEI